MNGRGYGFLVAGMAVAIGSRAADLPEIVVEANAPVVHVTKSEESKPGGARVDLYQVRYHVHLDGLDLSRQADVARLDELIHNAAVKGCNEIKDQYPLVMTSGTKECVAEAVKSAETQRKAALASALRK
jgi:UrcA family protein